MARTAAAIAEGSIGYWCSVRKAGNCSAKLFLKGVMVSHPTHGEQEGTAYNGHFVGGSTIMKVAWPNASTPELPMKI